MLCVIWFYSPFFFFLLPFSFSISTSLPSLNVQRTLPRPLLTWASPSSYLSFYLFNFHVKLLLPFALSTSQSLSLSLSFLSPYLSHSFPLSVCCKFAKKKSKVARLLFSAQLKPKLNLARDISATKLLLLLLLLWGSACDCCCCCRGMLLLLLLVASFDTNSWLLCARTVEFLGGTPPLPSASIPSPPLHKWI